MRDSRGRLPGLAFLLVMGMASSACGGSDDDSTPAATGAKGGSGGTHSGSGGTDANGGATDTGGTTGSGGSGGSSGKGGSSAAGGSSGAAGSTPSGGKGGTSGGGKGGSGGAGGSTGGSSGTGDGAGAGNTSDLLDAIGAACKQDCDAQFALDCAPQTSNTLTCQLSCAASTSELGDFCLAEYRDYVQCRADGDYDCLQGNPYPRATCAVEQLAFSQCTQNIGCKRFCQKTLDFGCNDTPFDTCVSSCTSGDTTLPSSCGYQQENIALCQATSAMACAGDTLEMPALCASSVLSIGECISNDSNDLCDGWCWAADRLGCAPSDCATDCATKKADSTCGTQWNALLDCALFFDDAACDGQTLALAGNGVCDSEQSAYQTCVMGGTGGTN